MTDYISLPIEDVLSINVWNKVRKRFPRITIPNAMNYALRKYLELEK